MNLLRKKREALGLTIEQAVELSGVNRGTLSRLERDEQRLDAYYLRHLANAYNCTLEELTPAEPGPPPLPRGKYKTTEPLGEEEVTRA
jgi:transcriptional regulator with XRE-family HTH domain